MAGTSSIGRRFVCNPLRAIGARQPRNVGEKSHHTATSTTTTTQTTQTTKMHGR
jgi:hypothetical protein